MHELPFDPYHKWLGIPPKDQPPDHYRLLGLERFESDLDVIAHAADARMAHIKSLATGAYSHLSQELLNAISAARVCLLNPQTKTHYDAALWERLEQQRAASPPVPPPLPGEQALPRWRQGLRRPGFALIAVGGAVGLFVLVAVVNLLRAAREPGSVAEDKQPPIAVEAPVVSGVPPLDSAEVSAKPVKKTAKKAVENSKLTVAGRKTPQKTRKPRPDATPSETEVAPSPEPESPPAATTPGETSPPPVTSGQSPPVVPAVPAAAKPEPAAKPAVSEKAEDPASQPMSEPAAKPATKPEAKPLPTEVDSMLAPRRLPVPSLEEQAKLQKQGDDVYKPAEATTPQKKLELAEKMFATGEETQDDPVSRYVLMRTAWRLAAEAGNLDLALDMIDRAHERYEFEPLEVKVGLLEQVEKTLGNGPEAETASQQLAQKATALVDLALQSDDFQTAMTLLEKIALPAARRMTDKQLAGDLTKRRVQVRRQREEFAEVEKAQVTLADNETDAEANLTLGRWYCLVKGEWTLGLPYLVKGSDKDLADLAQRELAGATSSQTQVELADAWWELAERTGSKQKELTTAQLHARAAYWYRQALPFLTGILREKAEKRLADTAAVGESRGEYALEFDGWKSHAIVEFGYPGTYPITIEAIVKPAVPPTPGIGTVIGNFDRTTTSGLMLSSQSALWGFCFVEVQPRPGRNTTPPPGIAQRLNGRSVVRDNEWRHVAGVFDGKQLRLYVDGTLLESRAVSGPHKPTTKLPFVIGACPALGPSGVLLDEYFKGLIKAVRISSVARYTDNFTPPAQLAREDANTQLLLVFNKGSGDTVPDTSGRRSSAGGSAGRKRTGTTAAKLVGTKWVRLDAPNSVPKEAADRGAAP